MTDVDTIKKEVAAVARANGARLAVLFGSYARGTADERSDVDLIVVADTTKRYIKRLDDYFDPLALRLEPALEVWVYTPAEFEDMKTRPFVAQALREGIVLYESGETPERSQTLAGAEQS